MRCDKSRHQKLFVSLHAFTFFVIFRDPRSCFLRARFHFVLQTGSTGRFMNGWMNDGRERIRLEVDSMSVPEERKHEHDEPLERESLDCAPTCV